MAAAKTQPVLDLETLDSFVVRIDGAPYQLRAPDALPAFGYKQMERLLKRFNELWSSDLAHEAEQRECELVLDQLCRLLLVAPAELHERLTDMQRLAVVQAFQQLPTRMLRIVQQQQNGAGAQRTVEVSPERPIGAFSPPASAGSTAGTRGGGSRKSRSASSAPATR